MMKQSLLGLALGFSLSACGARTDLGEESVLEGPTCAEGAICVEGCAAGQVLVNDACVYCDGVVDDYAHQVDIALLNVQSFAPVCGADGDCIVVPNDGACFGQCGLVTHRATAQALRTALNLVQNDNCQTEAFLEICGPPAACQPPVPRCIQGRCTEAP